MPKRRAAPVDEFDGDPSVSAKRARTEEGSDVPPTQTQTQMRVHQPNRTGNGKQCPIDVTLTVMKNKNKNSKESGSSLNNTQGGGVGGEEEEEEEDEGQQFEAKKGNNIRVKLESKRNGTEYIEMHQFICHKYLTISVSGSTSSSGTTGGAASSALTVALVDKANSASRGSGLKSFIWEGQSFSQVTVHLKNQGEEACKPFEYGKTIVIARRFTNEGGRPGRSKQR